MFVEYDFFLNLWVWYPEYLKLHPVQAQISFELKYSRMDEVKFVEAFKEFEGISSA